MSDQRTTLQQGAPAVGTWSWNSLVLLHIITSPPLLWNSWIDRSIEQAFEGAIQPNTLSGWGTIPKQVIYIYIDIYIYIYTHTQMMTVGWWWIHYRQKTQGFPGGTSGKEPICQCRIHKRCGFNPWVEKIPWRRRWQHTQVFLAGEFHGQRRLTSPSPWGCTESDTAGVT